MELRWIVLCNRLWYLCKNQRYYATTVHFKINSTIMIHTAFYSTISVQILQYICTMMSLHRGSKYLVALTCNLMCLLRIYE
jgi:hypothetical protein